MTTINDLEPAVIATVMRAHQSINMRNSNRVMEESLSKQGFRKELRDKVLAKARTLIGDAEPKFDLILDKLASGTSFEDVVIEQATFSLKFSAMMSGVINDMIQEDLSQNPEWYPTSTLNSTSES